MAYGLATSLILSVIALVAIWLPTLHVGPGIDALTGLVAWLATSLAVIVQVGATATSIRMLGNSGRSRTQTGRSFMGKGTGHASLPASHEERLLDCPPSVVEHTTFKLSAPGLLRGPRTTADQGS